MRSSAKRPFLFLTLSGLLLAAGAIAGCGSGTPASNPATHGSPTPTPPTPTPTPEISPTPSNTPTATPTPSGTPPSGGTYVPLTVGDTWSYDDTATVGGTKTTALASEAVEDIGGEKAGIMGTRLRETTNDPATGKVKVHLDWHEDRGVVVLRQREEVYGNSGALKHEIYYEPSRLILDMQPDHLVQGAVYYESYSDRDTTVATNTTVVTPHVVTWTMLGTESLTTPGGTFDCIKLHRVSQNATTGAIESDKTFWFAQNVGKVKESTLNVGDETLTAHAP